MKWLKVMVKLNKNSLCFSINCFLQERGMDNDTTVNAEDTAWHMFYSGSHVGLVVALGWMFKYNHTSLTGLNGSSVHLGI